MTEYTGFISSLIERSERVLNIQKNNPPRKFLRHLEKETDVTRLLLILNSGFSMIWERLVSVDGEQIRDSSYMDMEDFKIQIDKNNLSEPLIINKKYFFETIIDDPLWKIYKYKGFEERHNIYKLIGRIDKIEPIKRAEIPYRSFFTSLRHSFAHGGIHPLSPRQIGDGSSSEISKVYFVSKWTKKQNPEGFKICEFPVTSLYKFWSDWKKLLNSDNIIRLSEYDNQIIDTQNFNMKNVRQG